MLGKDAADKLAKIASELQATEGNYQIGVGTVAARLIERVIRDHPELLREFFVDETSFSPGIAAERREEYEPPKKRSRAR